MAEQRDVTDIMVFMSKEKVSETIHALSPEQRRFTLAFADTVKQPHEIWQAWVADPHNDGIRLNLRTYLQFLDLSGCEIGSSYGVSIVRFLFNQRWELYDMTMQMGEEHKVIESINQTYRVGQLMFPIAHKPC